MIDGIASLSIVPEKIVPEKIKSKNLNVEEEFTKANLKRTAAFVVVGKVMYSFSSASELTQFLGHVDHGKSTLMGRLLYDLKFVNEQTMRKFKKESEEIGKASFALAWVMDSTSDERSRGITVDTATKSFETEKTKFTILDAPGHLDFIPNMIAGASQADFAVLVIDAGINGFESGLKGQTKEHALLVRSMGVQRLVVAVNKMDRVDWSEERYNKIQEQTIAFLTAANFSSSQITFVPCAGLSGDNILTPISSPDGSWYAGPTLVEALDSIETAASGSRSKPLLLVTSDVFPNPTSANSTSIAGRLEAGSVQNGDRVLLQPANEIATVKSIDVDESPVDWAVAGQIITLNLVDVDASHIRRGDVASHPDHPLKTTSQLTLKILTFEHIMPTYMDMLRGRLQVSGRISELIATLDKTTGRAVGKKNPRVLQPGVAARVVLSLDREIPIAEGWRVVLRTEGRTIAAGLVENEASS